MSEVALISARKSWLETQSGKGDKQAEIALHLQERPDVFLSTAQIGITLIAIITGVYSGERFSKDLEPFIASIPFLQHYAERISLTIIVIIVTFLTIIFGELLPKKTGIIYAERIAKIVAQPMLFISKLAHPIIWLLTTVSNFILRIFSIRTSKDNTVTEEEIKAIISEGTEQGTIEEAEQEIIERVFHLGDRNITSLMTYRNDIIWFDMNESENAIKEKINQEPHSVYPVCDGHIDSIKGMVSIKDLYITPDDTPFKDMMKPAFFIPENNTAYQVLEKFKESKEHSAFIVDEYGTLLGMITLNDILEAIVGDMPQPDVEDFEINQREDGSYLVDAQIPFYDFLSRFDKTEWMNEGEQEFDTLAGFILHKLERIPKTGDKLDWRGFSFEVVDMDVHRIDKLLVTVSNELHEDNDEDF